MEMEYVRAQHLSQRTPAPELRHVLEFGAEHWEELTRCADDPHHPIDNNRDERQERLPVVIRKNAYGSGARWAVDQACQVWSIGQTLVQNGGQALAWTLVYFAACAQAGGRCRNEPIPVMRRGPRPVAMQGGGVGAGEAVGHCRSRRW